MSRGFRPFASMATALLVLLLVALPPRTSAELLMVYSVQRHGARNVLPKSSTLKESDSNGGPTLLPEGQRQAYNVGVGYLQRYLNASTCGSTCLGGVANLNDIGPKYGVVGTVDGQWNNFNTITRSSTLDRTIMTALSFLGGVFPNINAVTPTRYLPDGQQVVPVYSLPEDGNALIRGYSACPTYDARLMDWYASDEFANKTAETASFRNGIAAIAPGLNTSLTNWWNVYDGFNVYRTFGIGTPMPDIDNATFAQMQDLANWLELAKMRSNLTTNLLGGYMLADMLSYLDAAITAAESNAVPSIYFKMVHISSHYNTQLGVLAALALDTLINTTNITWYKKIPSMAAIMALELYASDDGSSPRQYALRMVYQDGPAANYSVIPLPCADAGAEALAGAGACTYDGFKALAAPEAINTTAQWCDACQPNVTIYTSCQLRTTSNQLKSVTAELDSVTASTSTSSSGSDLSGGDIAGIVIGVVAAVTILCGTAFWLGGRRVANKAGAAPGSFGNPTWNAAA